MSCGSRLGSGLTGEPKRLKHRKFLRQDGFVAGTAKGAGPRRQGRYRVSSGYPAVPDLGAKPPFSRAPTARLRPGERIPFPEAVEYAKV